VSAVRFVLAMLSLPVVGFGAALHPSLRRSDASSKTAAAFGLGAVLLTLGGMLLTAAGLRWSVLSLAALPLAVSAGLGLLWSRRAAEPIPPMNAGRSTRVALAAVAAVSLALLAWALVTGRATSVDYLFFWGVKAARFADVRGIDIPLLRWIFFSHAVPDYPPLVPVVQAYGALAEGGLPWLWVPSTSILWLAAAGPLIRLLLRRRLDGDSASVVTAFWIAAMCVSVATSLSGANAEAPLLFFESVAVAALLTEDGASSRFLPALMLVGAVLTKVEGTVAAVLLVGGVLVRDALEKRPDLLRRSLRLVVPPAAALGAWFLFQSRFGLRPGFRGHGGLLDLHFDHAAAILVRLLAALDAGTRWLSWALPLVLLIAWGAPRAIVRIVPALALTAGILAFLVFDYLHDRENPAVRISWTAPRVSQPALSALILAAGLASLETDRRRRSAGHARPSPAADAAANAQRPSVNE
jgi:hypothetical protein